MKKKKVLIVAGAMDVGGIENQLMHLLRKADKNEFQIDFTTTMQHPFYMDEMLELGAQCIHIPSAKGKHFLRYSRALYKVLKDGKYDIVHSHELFHSGIVLFTARAAGVKNRFVHAHNWSDGLDLHGKRPLLRKFYNFIMRASIQMNGTCFIACSTLAGGFLFGDRITRDKSRYHLIFNSVDTGKFLDHYTDLPKDEFCKDGWINVIQVGRFSAVKNQLFTARIAEELKRRGKKIRILCVGNTGNAYEEEVREQVKSLGIEEHMLLLGVRKDIAELMRQSAAFFLPSKYEGMPLVLIEAQASGLPCIAADTFSHEVDFGLGMVNWQKLDENVQRWTDLIEEAVQRPRASKQDVCRAIEEKGFDSDTFADRICSLYKRAVEQGK